MLWLRWINCHLNDEKMKITQISHFITINHLSKSHENILKLYRLNLFQEIAIGFNLQITSKCPEGLSDGLLVYLCKFCRHPCLQIIFDVAWNFVGLPLNRDPSVIIKGIVIWGVRRSDVGMMYWQKLSDSQDWVILLVWHSAEFCCQT